jgi:hypothetical protein
MDKILYRGAYRFADRATLDEALAAALQENHDWRSRFSAQGASLCVDLDLPNGRADQRTAAARVMQTLAYRAIEGIVVARQRDLAIDVFVVGE